MAFSRNGLHLNTPNLAVKQGSALPTGIWPIYHLILIKDKLYPTYFLEIRRLDGHFVLQSHGQVHITPYFATLIL